MLSKNKAQNILSQWDYNLNILNNGDRLTPDKVGFSSAGFNKKGYWFKCLDHPEHASELQNINNFTRRSATVITCSQCNSISTTHAYLIKYLINKEDGLKYSFGSKKKIHIMCPDCGYEKKAVINVFTTKGFSCPKCGDGISYPEKFMFSMLEQLNIEFKPQLSKTTLKWCSQYRYDFYIDVIHCIIEVNGKQHYAESNYWQPLDEIQKNDEQKKQLAKENSISNYIILNCKKSEIEWIKNSIMDSELPNLLNFKENEVNWLKCHESSCSNIVKEACLLWDGGIKNVQIIADKFKMSHSGIWKYLKQGAKLGWCDYDSEEEKIKRSMLPQRKETSCCVKVICLTTGEVFDSIHKVFRKYKINISGITRCCQGKIKSAGKSETGKQLKWMYYDEYVINSQISGWIDNYINTPNNYETSKVICLTTNEIFDSQKEAILKYKITNISKCCRKECKSAGKHPETGEPMVWMYYTEYLTPNYYE